MDILKKTGTLLYDIDEHQGYLVPVSIMNNIVKSWSKNRQLDINRVNELIHHLKQNGWIPPIIYVAEIPIEGLVCYDGNHRREAYRLISPFHDKQNIILDILKKPSEIYKSFNNINKSVPLAQIDLLMDQDSAKIRLELDNLMKEYEKEYPAFVSSSIRCNTPNFNRDNFKDQLYRFIEKKDFHVSVKTIKDGLKILNNAYSKDLRINSNIKNLRLNLKNKCTDNNFWLFAWRREILEEDLQWAIEQVSTGELIKL